MFTEWVSKPQLRPFFEIFVVFSSPIPQIPTDQLFLEGNLIDIWCAESMSPNAICSGLNNDKKLHMRVCENRNKFWFFQVPIMAYEFTFWIVCENEFCFICPVTRILCLLLQLLFCLLQGCEGDTKDVGTKVLRPNEGVATWELNQKFWLLGVSAPEMRSEGMVSQITRTSR